MYLYVYQKIIAIFAAEKSIIFKFYLIMKKKTLLALLLCPLTLQAQNVKLPWSQSFMDEQSMERFTVLDANVDDQAFKFNEATMAASCVRTQDADDWLVSPVIALKAGKTYEITYTISGESSNATESYEVKIGKDKTVAAMTKTIAAKTTAPADFIEKQAVTVTFSVDADGEYYIGWHFNTEMQLEPGSFNIYNIELKEKLGAAVPAAVGNAKVTPAPNGGNSADIMFNAPATNQAGAALSALTKIEVYRGEELVKTFNNPTPGAALNFTDTNVPNGKTTYKITPFSADGEGSSVELEAFVGFDIPAAVGKISFTYNNGKANVKWDKVTTGANGAYVNPDNITYTLRRGKVTEIAKGLKATTYEDTPPAQDEQEALAYVVSPVNEAGEGARTYSNIVVTGKPYALPLKESFANGKLSYFWLVDYDKRSRWSPFHDESSYAQDGDHGFAGFTPMMEGEWSLLETGLIDLGNAKDPMLTFYIKTHQNSEDIFKIWVSKEYGTPETLLTVNLEEVNIREWIKVELPLKKFVGSKFIQIGFDYKGIAHNSNIYVDNINIFDRKANDLAIKMKEAPGRLRVDNPAKVVVTVTNNGASDANNYKVVVYNDNKVITSVNGVAVPAGKTVENTITFTPERNIGDQVKLYAKLEVAADEDATNNTTETITLPVNYPVYPTAKNLQATAGAKNTLTWTVPDAPRATNEVVTESFEDYADFANKNIGEWLLYDVDNHTTYGFNESTFPGMGERQAWTVFNYSTTTPASGNGWKGHTGDKVLISFGAPYAITENWLVSPELPATAQSISLWEKAFNGAGNETYDVRYSTTGFNREDFQILKAKHVVPTSWAKAEYTLPEGTKYFAIVASSTDGYATLIDDISFLPASKAAQQLTLIGYNIYRDGVKVNAAPVAGTSFTDEMGGAHIYNVTAVYDKGEARFSNSAEVTAAAGIVEVDATADTNDENAPRYDVSGRRVSKDYKGIYISKGKKHIAK